MLDPDLRQAREAIMNIGRAPARREHPSINPPTEEYVMSEMKAALAATPEEASAQWSKLYREDAEFRAEFDRDPRAAMGAQVGGDLPDEVNVVVHRQNPGEIHITVPSEAGAEVTDEALSQVSGGVGAGAAVAAGAAIALSQLPPGMAVMLIPAFMLHVPGAMSGAGGDQP